MNIIQKVETAGGIVSREDVSQPAEYKNLLREKNVESC